MVSMPTFGSNAQTDPKLTHYRQLGQNGGDVPPQKLTFAVRRSVRPGPGTAWFSSTSV
jgi:hypothetical protein